MELPPQVDISGSDVRIERFRHRRREIRRLDQLAYIDEVLCTMNTPCHSRCELQFDKSWKTEILDAADFGGNVERCWKTDGLWLPITGVFAGNEKFDSHAGLAITEIFA